MREDLLTHEQRDALWKWRWLGMRHSTPAFKASIIVLVLLGLGLLAFAVR